ncbi:MAG TPA: Hsp33 family molecular chaperone HslO [Desulfuromonadales bacterium]|nr:Hsp33 family molecular chaperone HslO [Desulfuromonadales bacterium]
MNDHIVRALCLSGGIRILACSATALAQEITTLQHASTTASIAIARGVAAGALMGALLKQNQRIALKFEGNGPLRKLIIEAESDGAVRACAAAPEAELEPHNGTWDVAGLIGRAGFLTISKDLGVGGEPYRGVVQLVSSEIGEDLAYYLTDSEQTPSAVGVAAALDTEGRISVCGGFLVQALPKADPSEIETVMERIAALAPLSKLLQDSSAEGVIAELFGAIAYTTLESHELFFRCGCSRDKVESVLMTLGEEALREMQQNENGAEVSCEFCRQKYRFEPHELTPVIASVAGTTSA